MMSTTISVGVVRLFLYRPAELRGQHVYFFVQHRRCRSPGSPCESFPDRTQKDSQASLCSAAVRSGWCMTASNSCSSSTGGFIPTSNLKSDRAQSPRV